MCGRGLACKLRTRFPRMHSHLPIVISESINKLQVHLQLVVIDEYI